MFDAIDENKDGYLSAAELRALIIGIRFEEIDLNHDDAVSKVLKDFDASDDSLVDIKEFIHGVEKWLNEAKRVRSGADPGPHTLKFLDDFHTVSCRMVSLFYL